MLETQKQEDEMSFRELKKYHEGYEEGLSTSKEVGYLDMFQKALNFMKSIGVSGEHLDEFMSADWRPKSWIRSTSLLLTPEEEYRVDSHYVDLAVKEAREKNPGLLDILKCAIEVMASRGMNYWEQFRSMRHIMRYL